MTPRGKQEDPQDTPVETPTPDVFGSLGLEAVEELPAATRQTQVRTNVEEIIAALATRPGQWFKVATFFHRSTAAARARMFKGYEKVEAEVRGDNDVYARSV